MSSCAFVNFLKEAQIVPNIVGIESIQEIMVKMVPAASDQEKEFYQTK